MRTDDLIRTLVSDTHPLPPPPMRSLWPALMCGLAVSALAFLLVLGPRPDIAAAAATLRFPFKIVAMLLLFAAAVTLVLRMVRPGATTRDALAAVLAAPALLLAAVAMELIVLPPDRWSAAAIGTNSLVCLTAIPLLSIPILAAAIYALRSGAAVHPTLTGAVAGLLSAAAAAALYAIHCTDDSPLFVVIWYGIAAALVTAVGAIAGRMFLRW
jgi:hypothetical protein